MPAIPHIRSVSARQNSESATTAAIITPPAPPTNLSASEVSSTTVTLTWSDSADNETGFVVERSIGSSAFSEVDRLGVNVQTFTDTGLSASSNYTYRVAAFNDGGNSDYATTQVTTNPAPPVLSGPTTSSGDFTLSWSFTWPGGFATSQDRFVIEESTTSSTSGFVEIDSVFRFTGQTSYTINRTAGTYYYRVKAISFSPTAVSDYSNIATVAVNQAGSIPAPISNLTFVHTGLSEVRLDWQNNANNATVIAILESTDGSNFTEIGTISANLTSEPMTQLRPCMQYWYKLVARNTFGDAIASNAVTFSKDLTARITISNAAISPLLDSFGFTYDVGCFNFNNGTGGIGLYDNNFNDLLDNETGANVNYVFPREPELAGQFSSDWNLIYGKRYDGTANLVLLANFSTWTTVTRPQFVAIHLNVNNNFVTPVSMWGGDYNTNTVDFFGTVRGVVMTSPGAPGFSIDFGDLPTASNQGVIQGAASGNIFFVTPALPGEFQTTYGATVIMELNMPVYNDF